MQRGSGYVRPHLGHDRTLGRFRATMGLVTAMAVLTCGAIEVESAHAGTYVMRNCSVPGHPNAPLRPWTTDRGLNTTVAESCAGGGGVSFGFPGTHEMSMGYGSAVGVARPANGPQSEIRLIKASLWYTARLAGPGPGVNVYAYENHGSDTHAPWLVTGQPGAESLSFEQQLSPTTVRYSVAITCGPALGPVTDAVCVPEHETPFEVRGMEVTLSEDTPPSVLPLRGTLSAGGVQSGVRDLTYAASDPQSGLATVEVMLGDTVATRHDLAARCSYSDFTACPATDDGTLEVDTRSVPNGSYQLALRVRDAAGNERMVRGERLVDVVNQPTPVAEAPYAIAAKFKGSSRTTLTVPYGRRASLQGTLRHGSEPVAAGVPIDVLERADRRGAREKRTRTIVTKAGGAFSLGLATTRRSRVVRLAFGSTGAARVVSKALRLRVRAASRLRASLHGRVIRFSGTVLSRPISKRGKRVRMEGRSPGSAWTPFRNLRTDKAGRFSGTYRLRVRRPGVRLKIRAVVPTEAGYGYVSSPSPAVTLRVR